MGFKNSSTMMYEDGKWAEAPSDFWIQNAGKPVAQIIAEDKAGGSCGNEGLSPTVRSSTASPTPTPTPTTTIPEPTPATSTAGAAPLQPGGGDPFFIAEIEAVFKPPPSESAIQAIIPLAHQVCTARAAGQDDLQAAELVWAGKGVDTLGIARGSQQGLEAAALDIVGVATLAYCPKYNNGDY